MNLDGVYFFQMSAEHFPFYIRERTDFNIPLSAVHNELSSVYGDQARSLRTAENIPICMVNYMARLVKKDKKKHGKNGKRIMQEG